MQQSCNMQPLFQPHPFLGAIASTTLLSDCNTFRLLFMLTWPVLRRDNLSCSARGGVRPYRPLYLPAGWRAPR
jgi:hypothetical protein